MGGVYSFRRGRSLWQLEVMEEGFTNLGLFSFRMLQPQIHGESRLYTPSLHTLKTQHLVMEELSWLQCSVTCYQVCLGVWHGVSRMLFAVVLISQTLQRDVTQTSCFTSAYEIESRLSNHFIVTYFLGGVAQEDLEPRCCIFSCYCCTFKYRECYVMCTV